MSIVGSQRVPVRSGICSGNVVHYRSMFRRILNISKKKSFFLFGARATGKSTLLRGLFPDDQATWIDLLSPSLERRLARRPEELLDLCAAAERQGHRWVVLDEIQRVPRLLDVVHQMDSRSPLRFALTGSSARKLKRGAANLLAGRAFVYH